ncbi:hypothetical protein ACJJTC_013735 [Scirpophaga incertulas]
MDIFSKVIGNNHMLNILKEFARLENRCYLENAGTSLYPKCLLESVNKDLLCNVYSNPHSDKYTKDCIDQIRSTILNFFNTDSSMYSVIFTSGTTQSLKLVVESFQFASDENKDVNGSFVYLQDNHTSVIGLREIAAEKNADIIHISHNDFLEAIYNSNSIINKNTKASKSNSNNLLAYPAQSNFNGYKYPISCTEKIKAGCLNSHVKKHLCTLNCNWYVLLDAASFLSTNKLDLSSEQPDFICLSFYKIFGFPTGLGALLVKNSSAHVLSQKKYFGGGTVDIVLSSENYNVKREIIYERFEDGTVSFLSIIALKHCFDAVNKLVPKIISNNVMDTISWHTYLLAKDLYDQLDQIYHRNGFKAVKFYMDSDFTDIEKQGAIVTFSIVRQDETHIGYAEFQHMAELFNIIVRTGCFCNSGACQRHLNATNKEMKDMYAAGHKCGDEIDLINGRATGAIRVSFGYYNTFHDVDRLIEMINQCFIKTKIMKPIRLKHYYEKMQEKKYIKENHKNLIHKEQILKKNDAVDDICSFDSDITLREIAIFPVKSCAAFKIKSSWTIGDKGFEYDREWMIVKDNGVCLTQKQNTRMCLIRPSIDLKQRQLLLNCKGMPSISLPLDVSTVKKANTSFCQSKVCADIILGYDCGDEVADWVSNALEVSFLRMVRQSSDGLRVHKKKHNGKNKLLSLGNQAQFLLINQATIRWLSDKIEDPNFSHNLEDLTDRFRGNIMIEMDEELVERDWSKVIIGKHKFKVDGQCSRCQMVCIDQNTGEKTIEPLRTISEEFAGKLRFGIYLTYIGTVDGSKDRLLNINSPVRPIINDDNISRSMK